MERQRGRNCLKTTPKALLTLSLGWSATPGDGAIEWHAEGVVQPFRVDPRFQRESWWFGYGRRPQAEVDLAPSAHMPPSMEGNRLRSGTSGGAGETVSKRRRRRHSPLAWGSATPGDGAIKWHAEGVVQPLRVDPRFQRESWWFGYSGVADPRLRMTLHFRRRKCLPDRVLRQFRDLPPTLKLRRTCRPPACASVDAGIVRAVLWPRRAISWSCGVA